MANNKRMKHLSTATFVVMACFGADIAGARGVTPYLPLNLAPDIERQIERVMILGGRPVMRRPIAAAHVLDALPEACKVDRALCAEVRAFLDRYIREAGVTLLQLNAGATAGDSDRTMPNAHGRSVDSTWQVAAAGFYQPSDYLLLNVGGIAYDGRATPTGTMLSAGFDYAQLDVGYRDHWLSPLADSSFTISTQAPTLLSATLSNYQPISRLGITYEVFAAQMSRQEDIRHLDTVTSGYPRLAGLQLGLAPGAGYALTFNRVMQFGGGDRGGGNLSDLWKALTDNSAVNQGDTAEGEEFGNQIASVAASLFVPASTPFAVRLEYAGEDNSYGGKHRLGDTALSLGVDFPLLWDRYDLSLEVSEWQNVWYTHHLYPRGMTNEGSVIGHWFGDQRQFGDRVGGWSAQMQVGYRSSSGDYWRAGYRTLDFVTSVGFQTLPEFPYRPLHEASLQYSRQWRGFPVSAELTVGRDALGESFGRLMGAIDLAMSREFRMGESIARNATVPDGIEFYVNVGATNSRVFQILSEPESNAWTPRGTGYHFGAGVWRQISAKGDLGVGFELDDVDDHLMVSLRALDYRYRLTSRIAVNGFLGVGRYHWGAPAHGWYMGADVQWRNVLPRWDVGVSGRYYDKLSRNRVLPGDPSLVSDRPRMHFDIEAVTLYFSRRIE